MEKYNFKGPQSDHDNETDQKFMWIVPINESGSKQLSLQSYKQPYDLGFKSDGNEAVLFKGDKLEENCHRIFKFLDVQLASFSYQ